MSIRILTMALCVALPLASRDWEASLFLGRQEYPGIRGAADGLNFQYEPGRNAICGLRLGRTLASSGPLQFQVSLALQPKTTVEVPMTLGRSYYFEDHSGVAFGSGSTAVGVLVQHGGSRLEVGAGLDLRFERFEWHQQHASWNRPWLRGRVGWTLPCPVGTASLGLEGALPLASRKLTDPSDPGQVMRALAPNLQFGLYAGLRF